MDNLREVENINFAYTNLTLNKVYQMSFDQALQVIRKNNGKVENDQITIKTQTPKAVQFEKGFENLFPSTRKNIHKNISKFKEFSFEGVGIVLTGEVKSKNKDYVAEVKFLIDGKLIETAKLPAEFLKRRHELFWNYDLNPGNHKLTVEWLNPDPDVKIDIRQGISYINVK